MRLKIFTADSMKSALKKVREALGDDAIIINSSEEDGKVKITAAIDVPAKKTSPRKVRKPKAKAPAVHISLKDLTHADHVETVNLSHFLSHHGVGQAMMGRILETAAAFDEDNNLNALTKALDIIFHFSPINNDFHHRPIMLIGPPGVGKTVTAAKLTSQAVLSGLSVRLINTDTVRTGGATQLKGYAKVLSSSVIDVAAPELLAPAIDTSRQPDELVIIDTMGYNPFDRDEMAELHQFITAYDVEPILVIAAGMDPLEAREISETYISLGVRRFIAARLDAARRYGSLLAIASCSAGTTNLAFAGVGLTPYLANGIERVNALSLAKLLTRADDRKTFRPKSKSDPKPDDEATVINTENDELKLDEKEGKIP